MISRRKFQGVIGSYLAIVFGCKSKAEEAMPRDPYNGENGFKIIDQKYHPILDLNYWERVSEEYGPLKGDPIYWFLHPLDFIAYSKWREKVTIENPHNGVRTANDIVFWTSVPPSKPYLTRTGGAPFRDAHLPWPQKHGVDLTFIGQICFLDSIDLLPPLPGNLLLMFASHLNEITEGGPDDKETGLYLEWVTISEIKDPITEGDCPATFPVPKYSGVLHRYFDWRFDTLESSGIMAKFASLDRGELPFYVNSSITKIGPTYLEVQSGWDPRVWIASDEKLAGKWSLIATFHAISPTRQPDTHFLDNPLGPGLEFFSERRKSALIDLPGDPGHIVLFSGASPDKVCGYFIGG